MGEPAYSAIFIPTRNEAKGMFKHLRILSETHQERSHLYEVEKKSGERALVVLSGMGPALSRKAAQVALKKYPLRELWLFGLCGATQVGYEPGDAILAREIASEQEGAPLLFSDSDLLAKAQRLFEKLSQTPQIGKILSVSRVIGHPSDKLALGQKHDCLALEMEAYPLAAMAREKRIPFIQLRWVLDPAESEIPPLDFVDASGDPKALPALKAFAKNPPLLFKMIPFARQAQQALKNMNEFLHSYLEDEII